MPATPPSSTNDWNVSTLKEYIDNRFEANDDAVKAAFAAQKEAVNQALLAADRAVAKAEQASEKRFEGVNEFRKTLSDQTGTFLPRAEATARFDGIAEKLDQISSRLDKREGTGTGISSSWAILVSIIGIIGTILGATVLLLKF